MNRYRTRLFEAKNLEGKEAGQFASFDGIDLDEWMEAYAEDGYILKSIQPITYDSLYVVVTMDRVGLDTNDDA